MATLKNPVTPDDHVQGNPDAPITLLEYGDYQCPYCGEAYPVIKELQAEYADELRFVFRNFPLTQSHQMAEPAAEAAEYADTRHRFWEMHDALYENQERLSLPVLLEIADTLEIPTGGLSRALETHEFHNRIRRDFMSGVRSGVNGTPTFFINGVRHDGGFYHETLAAAIDSALEFSRRKTA